MKIFYLPDLGEGLPDAEITQWHVEEGTEIKADAPLASMETAKAVVEVPSPYTGRVAKLYGKPGDIIKTGAPLVEFIVEEDHARPDTGTVAGAIEVGDHVIEENPMGITPSQLNTNTIKAIPAVRALAKKLNVDLPKVTPTGPNQQITVDDVKKYADNHAGTCSEKYTVDALRGVRRAMANAMVQSHREVVPVTLMDDADIFRWRKETDITYRVVRAMVAGCKAEPALNSHFYFQNLERHLFTEVNIGIAIDSPEGLIVPVIKNAEEMDQTAFRNTINQLKTQVFNRTIPTEDLKGATIQLSNFGTLSGRYANPVLVPPLTAILGTGRIHEEVVAFEGQVAIHRIMPLSLTIDHRAITGGEAARFLATVIKDLALED